MTFPATRAHHTVCIVALLASCSGGGAAVPSDSVPGRSDIERRPVAPTVGGERVRRGISYGPYREGQRPRGPNPSDDQILEDLRLIAPRWSLIRIYGARPPAETIVRLIREHKLPLTVMVGAWIDPEARRDESGAVVSRLAENAAANDAEVSAAIALARDYPDVVFAVSVGNESQVFWSAHRTAPEVLIRHIRRVRSAIDQPVTTADDYNFWNKPESHAVAKEIDFLVLHAYAMWNRQVVGTAVAWTRAQVEAIAAEHPDLEVFLGETGWATERNLDAGGDEATQVVGVASEENQRRFYDEFTAMAKQTGLSYFYFEAFDEPWKGSPHPSGIEKHWGLFGVDRTPKLASADD